MVETHLLQAFLAVADTLHFGRAARRVSLSPQALSGRIKQLEQQLDATLFERTTRSVELSPGGRRLVPHVRSILQNVAACSAVVRSEQDQPFELTLGTRFELGLSWLTPALARLRELQPKRTLHLSFGDAPALMTRVVRGEIDATITSSRIEAISVEYEPIHRESYVFVAAPHLLASGSIRGPSDARSFVLLDERPDLPLFRYLKDARSSDEVWRFSGTEYLGTIGAIRVRALEGAGLAVLPEYFVGGDLEAGRLVRLLPKRKLLDDHFRLVWRKNHPLGEKLRALGRELRDIPLS